MLGTSFFSLLFTQLLNSVGLLSVYILVALGRVKAPDKLLTIVHIESHSNVFCDVEDLTNSFVLLNLFTIFNQVVRVFLHIFDFENGSILFRLFLFYLIIEINTF